MISKLYRKLFFVWERKFRRISSLLIDCMDGNSGYNVKCPNTFAQSPGVLNNLNSSNGRIVFTHQIAKEAELKNSNTDRYLIDNSLGRTTLNFKYGFSDRFTLGLDIPVMAYQGGFLDKPIEMIHQIAGFPYASRAMLNTNTSQVFLSGQQKDLYLDTDDFGEPGLGDIILMVKHQLYRSYIHGFALSSRIALKLPTGNYRSLHGSGSIDYGLDLTATKHLNRSFISTNLSAVVPGKWKLMPHLQVKPSYSWILSYEYLWGNRISVVFQNLVQSSHFEGDVHSEISKAIFEWTAGLKYDIGNGFRLSFAITENYLYHNNTADFGFHFGITRGF
jgi:hypothetical protein